MPGHPNTTSLFVVWDFAKRFDELQKAIEEFSNRGLHGASLIVRHVKSKNFISLHKYIESRGVYRIEMSFSFRADHKGSYKKFAEYMNASNLHFDVDPTPISVRDVNIRADFGRDIFIIGEAISYIFREILRLPGDEKFDIEVDNISLWHEIIDTPGQEPAGRVEGFEVTDRWYTRTEGYSMLSATACGLLVIVQMLGIIGLIFTLFFQSENWKSTHIAVGTFDLSVPWPGLVSVCLILLGFLHVLTDPFWVEPKKGQEAGYVRIPRTVKNAFRFIVRGPLNWLIIGLLAAAVYVWHI